ncbi:hypothetical protein Bca52824_015521 [Brassica carinata]|uniref:Uncharacterized protein n=1 Tax=Brassica carinata TaxID=52824 RepID=A0A8X7W1W5_BRACI|nr:hypothetical protein Bca52824_015521 [Brassica carinata]
MRDLQYLRLQFLFRTLFAILVTLLMIDAFVLQNNSEAETAKEFSITAAMNNSIVHAKDVQQELQDGPRHGDLSYVGSKEQCLVDLTLYTTGKREIQDDHREEHKYGESLGKKQREREKYLLANRSCNAATFSFTFVWDRIF